MSMLEQEGDCVSNATMLRLERLIKDPQVNHRVGPESGRNAGKDLVCTKSE